MLRAILILKKKIKLKLGQTQNINEQQLILKYCSSIFRAILLFKNLKRFLMNIRFFEHIVNGRTL